MVVLSEINIYSPQNRGFLEPNMFFAFKTQTKVLLTLDMTKYCAQ